MANATTNAIFDNVRARLPGVADDQIKLELFNVVDELAREALRVSAPTDVDAEPDTWLTSTLWVPNYQVLLEGTLARLYAQNGKPYSSPEFAKAHFDRFAMYLTLSRSEGASAPSSTYERVLFTLRMRVPVARDADLQSAIFIAADKIRVEALLLAPLLGNNNTPTSWLPDAKWDVCYQSLLFGSLAHLYLEGNKPWSAPDLGQVNLALFTKEMSLLRIDEAAAPATVYQRVLNAIRVQLPEARESVVTLAAFGVINKIRVNELDLVPLVDANTTPSGWLPTDQWDNAYLAVLHGSLATLQMQTGQPWHDPTAAAVNNTLFDEQLNILGTDALATPSTVYQRMVNAVRVQLPSIRESAITLAAFAIADKIRLEALQLTALVDSNTTPSLWLPTDKWDEAYPAMLYGTLAALQVQTAQPWSNPTSAAANQMLFLEELGLLRADSATTTTVYQRFISAMRLQIPQVRPSQVTMAAFAVADKIRLDALILAPLADADTDPSLWIPTGQWDDCYSAMLYGTLAALQMQATQPWANPTLAAANHASFLDELGLLRTDAAATPTSVYQRLLNAIRVQLPNARESVVTLAAFAIANKLRIDALRLAPLVDANTAPSGWLPTDQWDNAYQAMLYGTLSNLQMQTGQPWSNPASASANHALFLEEFLLLRGDQASAVSRGIAKLMDLARVRLPGARDNIILLELFAVMNDFFQNSNCWYEDIDFTVALGQTVYYINPTSIASPVRLLGVANAEGRVVNAVYAIPDTLTLLTSPPQTDTYTARVALTVTDPVTRDGYPIFPSWVLDKYNNDILDGVLGRMMSQIAKPYSNERMAVYHMRQFRGAVAFAKVEAMHQNVYRGQNWKFPQAFARRKAR